MRTYQAPKRGYLVLWPIATLFLIEVVGAIGHLVLTGGHIASYAPPVIQQLLPFAMVAFNGVLVWCLSQYAFSATLDRDGTLTLHHLIGSTVLPTGTIRRIIVRHAPFPASGIDTMLVKTSRGERVVVLAKSDIESFLTDLRASKLDLEIAGLLRYTTQAPHVFAAPAEEWSVPLRRLPATLLIMESIFGSILLVFVLGMTFTVYPSALNNPYPWRIYAFLVGVDAMIVYAIWTIQAFRWVPYTLVLRGDGTLRASLFLRREEILLAAVTGVTAMRLNSERVIRFDYQHAGQPRRLILPLTILPAYSEWLVTLRELRPELRIEGF